MKETKQNKNGMKSRGKEMDRRECTEDNKMKWIGRSRERKKMETRWLLFFFFIILYKYIYFLFLFVVV